MKRKQIAILVVPLISFLIGVYYYHLMPERMAVHWSVFGQMNGYISKLFGLFLMPLTILLTSGIFLAIPYIDPLKANIAKSRKQYDTFAIILIVFLLVLYIDMILWNLGIRNDLVKTSGLAIVLYYTGIYLENVKPNWFIGVRTPWTLSNEVVWNKTNKVGGKLLKIISFVQIIGIMFPNILRYSLAVPLVLEAGFLFIYSYVQYQKEIGQKEG